MEQEQNIITGRLTSKKLLAWLNQEFKKYPSLSNIDATNVVHTRYSRSQYEAGACRLHIYFTDSTLEKESLLHRMNYLTCDYTLSEYQDHLNSGYELYLKFKSDAGLIRDAMVELRLKQSIISLI